MDADKSCPLAVGVPVIGLRSETFVRSHANDVLQGRSVCFGESRAEKAFWQPEGPTFTLYSSPSEIERKVRHNLERSGIKLGERALIHFLKEHGVEVVVSEYLHSFLPFLRSIKAAGIRWYSFGHGYDVSALLKDDVWRARLMVQKEADGIFVRANSVRDRLIDLGFQGDRVHTVYSSAPVPELETEHRQNEHVRLLYVGRMVPKKGPTLLIEAFAKAWASNPSLRLEMIGEGPELSNTRTRAVALGLGESVNFLGAQSHETVLAKMKLADIYVQHSLTDPNTGDEEGLPASILEAMGHCLPVVSTHHAGIPEAVRDGIDGLLSDEGDVDAMASNIIRLSNDFRLRNSMGSSAYARARTQFSWARERKDILRLTGMEKYA